MGLNKGYRTFRDEYIDNGETVALTMPSLFIPDFKNRHTMQRWAIAASNTTSRPATPTVGYSVIERWAGETLQEHTLHEIFILNNTNYDKFVLVDPHYDFVDENIVFPEDVPVISPGHLTYRVIYLPPNSTAHYVATALSLDHTLKLIMRKGSQDSR